MVFGVLRPFAIAALSISILEGVMGVAGTNGNYNTDFFDFSPLEQDNLQKHTLYDKYVRVLGETPGDAVQVGDSSGFYGINPAEVTRVASGISYLNMSCCGDAGWNGYYYEAEAALKRKAAKPKYLVLHVTPFWAPGSAAFYGDNSLAVLIRDYIGKEQWWHKIRMPSEGYRLRVLNLVDHGLWLDDFAYENHAYPTIGYPTIHKWRELIAAGRGFIPIPVDIKDPVVKRSEPDKCKFDDGFSESRFFGLEQRDLLYDYLKHFAELAKSVNARFIFVSNPVPCIVSQDAIYADVERQMARFKHDYPDAIIPFATYFHQAPLEEFSDRWHLKDGGVVNQSRAIGTAIKMADGQTSKN